MKSVLNSARERHTKETSCETSCSSYQPEKRLSTSESTLLWDGGLNCSWALLRTAIYIMYQDIAK